MSDSVKPLDPKKLDVILRLTAVDKAFRKRFIEQPREVFEEIGIEVPKGMSVLIIEAPPNTLPIAIPAYEGSDDKS